MRFCVLGPLEAWDNEQRLKLGGPQQRGLLAVLLLEANHVVSVDRLVECLWGERPPETARSLLQGCVAQLRRVLRAGDRDRAGQRLVTRSPGYSLEVGPGELDLDRFEELASTAAGSLTDRSELLSEALSLWRGPALDDISLDVCRAAAVALEERRLAVLEERIDVDLQRGRHVELVGELQAKVTAHPLRERLWAQLMLALYAADRRADALAAYQRLRRMLIEQLGVEPGRTVREVHERILAGGDVLAASSRSSDGQAPETRSVPAQLPAAVAGFTGRLEQLARLDGLRTDVGERLRIGVVSGMAGVGKTALAVSWAQRVRERFPDGQLYVNLRGYDPAPPIRPVEALAGFLRGLGVPAEQIPVELEQAAALFRTLLAGKRVVVVLDNARSTEQVRPLLPGDPGCLVVVTSRNRLAGLVARDGARSIALDVLEPDEAYALLGRILGSERVDAEPDAAKELSRVCARLPLALRIAAANLTLQPRRDVADQVAELSSSDRLVDLAVEGDEQSALNTTFGLSYAALDPEARRLFRLLGLIPGPDVTAEAAGALADLPPRQAARLLDRLADAHLLEQHAKGRYVFHDLLRLYAADRARDDEPADDREAAIRRLFDAYLRTADAADRLLSPSRARLALPDAVGADPSPLASLADHIEAAAWLDAERADLVAIVQYAAEHGPRSVAWHLAHTLKGLFQLRMYTHDWQTVAETGWAAAEAEGDLIGQAAGYLSLGSRSARLGDYWKGIAHYTHGLELAREAGWLEGECLALAELGSNHRYLGHLREAADYSTEAVAVARRTGSQALVQARLINVGNLHAEAGEFTRAVGCYSEALSILVRAGHRAHEAVIFVNLGECYLMLGRLEEALTHINHALDLNRELGHRGREADNLRALAAVHLDAGRHVEALELAQAAVAASRETGDRRYEAEALNVAGSAFHGLGDFEPAAEQHEQALRMSRTSGIRQHEIIAFIGLASSYPQIDRLDEAASCAEQARVLAGEARYRVLEAAALTACASVALAQGRVAAAIETANQALAVERTVGHRLGEARTLDLLSRALLSRGESEKAAVHRRQALDLFTAIGLPEAADMPTAEA